jgi:hypothetical protein
MSRKSAAANARLFPRQDTKKVKTKSLAIGRPKEEEINADYGVDEIRRPCRNPTWHPVSFSECKKQVR